MSFFSLFIPLIILVAYLFTMLVTVGNTVTEKSTKMKVNIINQIIIANIYNHIIYI